MTIELTNEQEQFIKQQLDTGVFASESEVFQEALSALQKQQRDLTELKDIFAESHKQNAHLNIEATEAMIAEEVRAHHQEQNR